MDHSSRMRPADPAHVKVRPFEPTREQEIFQNYALAYIGRTCANSEEGVAFLVYMLSDFITRTAKPELLPEAVETAIRCLRINAGLEPPPA